MAAWTSRIAGLAAAALLAGGSAVLADAPAGAGMSRAYRPLAARGPQVAFHFHVVGTGGTDPYTPGLVADYRAVGIDSTDTHYLAREGQEQWFSWSALFPRRFPTQRGWGVFAAWKALGLGWDGEANLRLDVTDDVLHLYVRGGNPLVVRRNGVPVTAFDPRWGPRYERDYDLGPLLRGVWQSFLLHVRWSVDPQQGFVELYRSVAGGAPVQILPRVSVSTLYADRPAVRFPAQDLYHKGAVNVGTVSDVYQTPMQWGPTLAAALSTPSPIATSGTWVGDRVSTGGAIPLDRLPVPLPRSIPWPRLVARPAPLVAAQPGPGLRLLGNTAPGTAATIAGEGYKLGVVFPLAEPGTAVAIRFLASGGAAPQSFTPVLYATDASGAPTTLAATGPPVTVPALAPAGWVTAPISSASLAPGSYLVGLRTGGTDRSAWLGAELRPGAGVYTTNVDPAPTAAWDGVSRSEDDLSIALEYRPAPVS